MWYHIFINGINKTQLVFFIPRVSSLVPRIYINFFLSKRSGRKTTWSFSAIILPSNSVWLKPRQFSLVQCKGTGTKKISFLFSLLLRSKYNKRILFSLFSLLNFIYSCFYYLLINYRVKKIIRDRDSIFYKEFKEFFQ